MGFVLMAFGAALMLSGGLWTLQGLGLVMWPAESLILGRRERALYGAIAFLIGLFLFRTGSRRG
ncbi:MAG: hypothetical protein AB3N06_03455 [Erythrobacter sp.]